MPSPRGDPNRVLPTIAPSADSGDDSDDEFIPRAPLKTPSAPVKTSTPRPAVDKTKIDKPDPTQKNGESDTRKDDDQGEEEEESGNSA